MECWIVPPSPQGEFVDDVNVRVRTAAILDRVPYHLQICQLPLAVLLVLTAGVLNGKRSQDQTSKFFNFLFRFVLAVRVLYGDNAI